MPQPGKKGITLAYSDRLKALAYKDSKGTIYHAYAIINIASLKTYHPHKLV